MAGRKGLVLACSGRLRGPGGPGVAGLPSTLQTSSVWGRLGTCLQRKGSTGASVHKQVAHICMHTHTHSHTSLDLILPFHEMGGQRKTLLILSHFLIDVRLQAAGFANTAVDADPVGLGGGCGQRGWQWRGEGYGLPSCYSHCFMQPGE